MTAPRPTATKTPLPDREQVLERFALMDKAIRQTDVQLDELESALGMYMIGFHFGWKVLHVIHSKKTIAKYEAILGIKVRDAFPEYGPDADRTNAYKIIQSVSNFWKLVSGDERSPVELDKRSLSQ